MDPKELIAKLQSFFYLLRRGRTEQLLAILVVLLFSGATYVRQELPRASYVVYGLCAALALILVVRLWKVAAPPPPPPDAPVSAAVKGLLPFTVADGHLFARLGRKTELQWLLALGQNEQIPVSVVRGESGAGKTSLLQAGLAFTLGAERCVYWEAVAENPADALLHALRSRVPELDSLESLPQAWPQRGVLIMDQFEQLRLNDASHAPIFNLVERIAKGPAPHALSLIVGFRREYTADWLDFEQARSFRAEQLPVNLLAPTTAADALVTLAGEAGFTLDEALVRNFIASVTRSQSPAGVSPVEVAIGLLSLANFVQQRGTTHVGLKEYELAGGSEGLLLSFVQQKLEEIPETARGPLLKGLVLALVDPSKGQRVSAGETPAGIASKAEVPESSLATWLQRLAHARVRLLEKVGDRYRLPHDRLVPVLQRLTGKTLAAIDQLRLLFESEYARWRETRNGRHLLRGKDLRGVLASPEQFMQGESASGKTEYLMACLRWRRMVRIAACAAALATAGGIYGASVIWDDVLQKEKLTIWEIPPEIFHAQQSVDALSIGRSVNDLHWLRSSRLRELHLYMSGHSLDGIEKLRGLDHLELGLGTSHLYSLKELEKLPKLTNLKLEIAGFSGPRDLGELAQLQQLTALELNFSYHGVESLQWLANMPKLSKLTLAQEPSSLIDIDSLGGVHGLTSLDLGQVGNPADLQWLEKLEKLNTLRLDVSRSRILSLAGLRKIKSLSELTVVLDRKHFKNISELGELKGLKHLTIEVRYEPTLIAFLVPPGKQESATPRLGALEQLKDLASLSLILPASEVAGLSPTQHETEYDFSFGGHEEKATSLEELGRIRGLTSLTIDLRGLVARDLPLLGPLQQLSSLGFARAGRISAITDLSALGEIAKIRELTLDVSSSAVNSLREFRKLKRLEKLNLDLQGSQVSSLEGLEGLDELTDLTLDLRRSSITDFTPLEHLKKLKSLEIKIPESALNAFIRARIPRSTTKLWIAIDDFPGSKLDIPSGFAFVGLQVP